MRILNKKNIIGIVSAAAIYVIVQLLIGANIIDPLLQLNLMLIGINVILAIGLNLITGFTGQFSLGHAGFMSVGAYVSAIVTVKMGQPFFVGIIAAALGAAITGILIGVPTLRLKGDYLAIATLGFGEIIRIIFQNMEYVGGASGFNDIPQYTNWTWLFAMVLICIVVVKNFIDSDSGRACIAIREDEIAAEAMGVNTTYYKVLAFVIGAFFAGIAGALYAHYFYFITPGTFGFMKSIDILVIVVFGGLGSIAGSILGAIALTILSLLLQSLPELRMVVYSVILFLIMVYRPQGLLGSQKLNLNKYFRKGGKANAGAEGK